MLRKISRRSFVAYTGALVAFAPVLKTLAVDRVTTASAADPFPRLDGPVLENRYLGGSVQSISGKELIAVTASGKVTVALPGNDGIWKGDWNSDLVPEVGDDFHAWGERTSAGRYRAEKIHFNIRNVTGEVSVLALDGNKDATLTLLTPKGAISVLTDAKTVIVDDEDELPARIAIDRLADGKVVQVLGLERNGAIQASRVFPEFSHGVA